MITLDNMKSFDVNFIELYWEMKFTGILEVELPYEWKSSALGKNRIFTKIIFQKLSAQDLGGRTVCGILQKWCDSWKYCLLQGKYDFFSESLISKFLKKCPRDVKSALGISGVGEG